jgi:hypothetical protein
MLDISRVTDLEVDGIDWNDYPDFCDAYISGGVYVESEDFVRDLTDEEIEWLNENHSDIVYQAVMDHIY